MNGEYKIKTIKQLRIENNLKQEELSVALGVTVEDVRT